MLALASPDYPEIKANFRFLLLYNFYNIWAVWRDQLQKSPCTAQNSKHDSELKEKHQTNPGKHLQGIFL